MTGFGAASREADGLAVRAEVRSVNHRGLAVSLRVPASLDAHTAALEAPVRTRLTRGSVSVSLHADRRRASAPARLQRSVIEDYLRQADAIAEAIEVPVEPPTFGDVLRLPGVFEDAPAQAPTEAEVALLAAAVDAACDALVGMREREGAALAAELGALVDEIEACAARVAERVPAAVAAQHQRLRERLAQILAPGQAVPEELVAREIAVLADRTDVAEEVSRLRSHAAQVREALAAGGPVGRRLDFLAQELAREANTTGSKCQDAEIARIVVDLKVLVERFKEQAANVE